MIKYAFFAAGLLLAGAYVARAALADDFVGEKPLVQTPDRLEWAWDGGDRAGIAVPATVHYQAGGAPRVIVRGPADLLARVRFDHGELQMENSSFNWHFDNGRLDVTLIGMTLDEVALAGSGDVHMGSLHQDRLALSIAGSGSVDASGQADDLTLDISGSGRGDISQLAVKTMAVNIAGSGRIDAASPAAARVSIMGSGDVHFAVMPKTIHTSIMGSGRVSDASGYTIDKRHS